MPLFLVVSLKTKQHYYLSHQIGYEGMALIFNVLLFFMN